MSRNHRLVVPLTFPQGLHPGAGKDLSNRLMISRNGLGQPVLRGTALAGALRQAYVAAGSADADQHFGRRNVGSGDCSPSRLKVADVVLDTREGGDILRHHNSLDRHIGAVRDGSLFDLEALAPGCTGTAVLVYHDDEDESSVALTLLANLLGYLAGGITLGGKAARGIGGVALAGVPRYRCFNLASLDDHAAWLDEQYDWRGGHIPVDGDVLSPQVDDSSQVLSISLTLTIRRGQDVLIADGQGSEYELQPQRFRHADGKDYWRLPGASLRGVLRAWISRLAVRDGHQIDDRAERYDEVAKRTGDHIAWGFDNPTHDPDRLPDCPILGLFGSAGRKGRIHITDGQCAIEPGHAQVRMHVAVDRITGGASEGFLFDSEVLCGSVEFPINITVRQPEEHEARWLAQSLQALDLGLIRVGSSKAVGALNVRALSASGPHNQHFEALRVQEVAE